MAAVSKAMVENFRAASNDYYSLGNFQGDITASLASIGYAHPAYVPGGWLIADRENYSPPSFLQPDKKGPLPPSRVALYQPTPNHVSFIFMTKPHKVPTLEQMIVDAHVISSEIIPNVQGEYTRAERACVKGAGVGALILGLLGEGIHQLTGADGYGFDVAGAVVGMFLGPGTSFALSLHLSEKKLVRDIGKLRGLSSYMIGERAGSYILSEIGSAAYERNLEQVYARTWVALSLEDQRVAMSREEFLQAFQQASTLTWGMSSDDLSPVEELSKLPFFPQILAALRPEASLKVPS